MRAGAVDANADTAVGAILRDGIEPNTAGLTIADLTGVGATDAAVAMAVYQAAQ